jgi:hypothetical protein
MKKIIHEDYRLEIHPDLTYVRASDRLNHKAMRQLLDDIERQIKRHVDDIGQIVPTWTTREECSHCGYAWEELTERDVADPANLVDLHSVVGEPVCCGAAIEEFRTERGIPLPQEAL